MSDFSKDTQTRRHAARERTQGTDPKSSVPIPASKDPSLTLNLCLILAFFFFMGLLDLR